MKKIILRNDPGKKRKKLGKVKDLFEKMDADWNEFEHFINPLISDQSREKIITDESCLSVPGKTIKVERSKEITIYFEKGNHDGNHGWESHYKGMDAIVIQLEIDHLNGIIITDKKL